MRLLLDHVTVEQPVHAVFLHRTHVPSKVRVIVDYLVDHFARLGRGGACARTIFAAIQAVRGIMAANREGGAS
ncbi:hypothetical protein OEZ60_12305 [Defluviimonas sp. WL0024]|uniref:LysR substrate binding domain-containing protein n=2 Tax=Albidovulum TaxID=205889 RepID=A0ABT3J3A1_9RHOB|nr:MULTISPECIES: hypothetical protein [Defluviimonas]MCU9848786.1 hypothetical protein [Defluviimonas sp. WL0024]MCW3782148.1 hypothetical protein [Defluviimonas salinarum]